MDYKEVIAFLYNQLPVFHREGKKAFKPGLGNIQQLCERLGNPQDSFKALHIAGTNGKGSSSHFMASILQEHGFRVGLYTSPHLKSFTERIKINGQNVAEDWVVQFVEKNLQLIQDIKPSFFEWTVLMAFSYFKDQQVDWAVIETGLGGRLDSTNIILPKACLITNISWDHQDILGDTLELIAEEKAGIIKQGVPICISERQSFSEQIFQKKAEELNAPIVFAEDKIQWISYTNLQEQLQLQGKSSQYETFEVSSPYAGEYQVKNIAGILAWCEQIQSEGIIPLQWDKILVGIEKSKINTQLHGRWELIQKNPWIVADTGHNESGISQLLSQVKRLNQGDLWIILGMVADKDIHLVLKLFPKEAHYIFCQAQNPRALTSENLQKMALEHELVGFCENDVNKAIEMAKHSAKENDFILITGSTYLVAEINV
ncbi:bifunctional folylpolyglutamate synthase/dihydrofolate synthase [Aquirufa nivalisilvae]|uniref:bifunctional folylpolyglutamate synthase/dihydrofolate synthase n=1 Tax=Aquirufa nivalisilvae TaxID=2516557 RepID=UPI0022A8F7F9|nr:folylpolyglutamate synthase/dihydrofolate synthase family protein [Aquirufa nivalisilvae]MCZ2479979.1 bifunctional folylpolyglutamate synthase/dihydrofolate synthase [Aquirufa nivalisilvae]